MVDIKSMAAATAPREFELSYTTTIEDVYEKLKSKGASQESAFPLRKNRTSTLRSGSLLRMATKLKSWQTSRRTQQPSMVCELTKTA